MTETLIKRTDMHTVSQKFPAATSLVSQLRDAVTGAVNDVHWTIREHLTELVREKGERLADVIAGVEHQADVEELEDTPEPVAAKPPPRVPTQLNEEPLDGASSEEWHDYEHDRLQAFVKVLNWTRREAGALARCHRSTSHSAMWFQIERLLTQLCRLTMAHAEMGVGGVQGDAMAATLAHNDLDTMNSRIDRTLVWVRDHYSSKAIADTAGQEQVS